MSLYDTIFDTPQYQPYEYEYESFDDIKQTDEIVVWVNTLEKYNQLMKYLQAQNYAWFNGEMPTVGPVWDEDRSETCICLEKNKKISYCDRAWFIKHKFKIISFEDFMEIHNPQPKPKVNLNKKMLQAMGIK